MAEKQSHQVGTGMTVLLWLPFEDGMAGDATGNGHNGTIHGTPAATTSLTGGALMFDSAGDYITITNDPQLETPAVTISMWLKPDQFHPDGSTLLDKSTRDKGYRIELTDTRKLRLIVFDSNGSAEAVTPFKLTEDFWAAVVASYDGTKLRLHVDAKLVSTTMHPGIDISSVGDISIAANQSGTDGYIGSLDEIMIGDGTDSDSDLCLAALKVWDPAAANCIDSFVEIGSSLGLEDVEDRHFGICMVDVDKDGWIDLYYANGAGDPPFNGLPPDGQCVDLDEPPDFVPGSANKFYYNLGDGIFSADVAPAAGIADEWNAMRHVFGDYDNDGLRDLISHNFILSPLYHAIPGTDPMEWEDGSEQAEMQICIRNGTGASWVDLNNDGWLDMYAVEYRPNNPPKVQVHPMYLNDRDGTFTEITQEAGVTHPNNPMGTTFADYDNDGDQDVYISNSPPAPARLYQNQGPDPETGIPYFVDVAPDAGVDVNDEGAKGIGVAWGDYDNDGRLDLLFVRETDTRLFHNDGPNKNGQWTFSDATAELDLDTHLFWGGNFMDLNNDGLLDIILTDRFVNLGNVCFLNRGGGEWQEFAALVGMDIVGQKGMGVVAGDIDNDGDVDVAITNHNVGHPNYLYRNDTRGNNWIQFRLTGTSSNLDAIGARITVSAFVQPGEPIVDQMREVVAGTGFFSDFPRIQTFGLGKATQAINAVIRWPNGRVQETGQLNINRLHDFVEAAMGDFDGDGDFELDDYARLAACLSGPRSTPTPPPPTGAGECLGVYDFDHDHDVDLADSANFNNLIGG